MPNGTFDPDEDFLDPDEDFLARDFNHGLWVGLRRDQLGMTIYDADGHHIGTASARSGQSTWIPVGTDKRVLVGELDYFYAYRGPGDEVDWNIRITPDRAFRNILTDVVEMMSREEQEELVERKQGSGFCVECEITPDEDLYWYNPIYSDLLHHSWYGQLLAVYGPWVRDMYHGGRPEIHPCEAIWWSREAIFHGVSLSRFMLVVQDDSERFGRASDYTGPVPRPWSDFPRRANIIAALRPQIGMHLNFDLHVLHSREMAGMTDAGPVSMTRNFNGRPVITVTKRTTRPETIRMRLSEVARDPDGKHLRCFLNLAISVGHDDNGREGHALMRLDTLNPRIITL
jgi:hypothetical protein